MHRHLRSPADAAPLVPLGTTSSAAVSVPTTAPGLLRSLVATGACGASATILAAFGASTAQETPGRLDEVVSIAVLAVGAGAAALLTVSCFLLTLTAVARATGRTLGRLERVTTRLTPALLRRAVAMTITSGIGLGAVSGVATASEIDLGWEVTESTSAPAEPAHPAPPTAESGPAELATADPGPAEPTTADPGPAEPDAADPGAYEPATVEPGPAEPDAAVESAPGGAREPSGSSSSVRDPAGAAAPGAARQTAVVPASDAEPTPAGALDPAPVTVTVVAGDTLWGIAASHLPAGSDDAAVAAAWPRWYEANRDVVGPDPDLIHPGQVLAAPGAS